MRSVRLSESPPGLYNDEAANIWASWCLLKTGRDDNGTLWPIFSTRGFGENRSTLYDYWLIPFLAVGGLSVTTARIASATAGVLSVALAYLLGAALWDRRVGLVAAGLLAVCPWGVFASRWAHESSLVPLGMMLPLAAMLWAGLPLTAVRDGTPPRPIRSFLAGLASGLACYGYPPIRIVLPLVLAGVVLVSAPAWMRAVRTWARARAVGAFALGLMLTFGPLAYQHLAHGEKLSKRAIGGMVFNADDAPMTKVDKVLARYPGHFNPSFLFVQGDPYEICFVPERGLFGWYMAPLMLVGLLVSVWQMRRSYAARALLVWLALYPAGDLLITHFAEGQHTHALRSLPGLGALILLAAVGGVAAWDWLRRRRRWVAVAALACMVPTAFWLDLAFYIDYFGAYSRSPVIRGFFNADHVKALRFIRPRLRPDTHFFITIKTSSGFPHPYVLAMVELNYDPRRWLADEHDIITDDPGAWEGLPGAKTLQWTQNYDLHVRVGSFHFLYFDPDLEIYQPLLSNGRPDHVILILRPDEPHPELPLVHQILEADGTPVMDIYEGQI